MSDDRIIQAQDLMRELRDWSPASRATPQMAQLLVDLYEQERIGGGMLGEVYALLAVEWAGVGEPWLATRAGTSSAVAFAFMADNNPGSNVC